MGIHWNWSAVKLMEMEAAKRILYAAQFFENTHAKFLSVQNSGVRVKRTRKTVAGKRGSQYTIYPDSSKKGEYPRKRTGEGIGALIYAPTTEADIIAAGLKVRIGVQAKGKHLAILELFKGRLGFEESAKRLNDQVKAILHG